MRKGSHLFTENLYRLVLTPGDEARSLVSLVDVAGLEHPFAASQIQVGVMKIGFPCWRQLGCLLLQRGYSTGPYHLLVVEALFSSTFQVLVNSGLKPHYPI